MTPQLLRIDEHELLEPQRGRSSKPTHIGDRSAASTIWLGSLLFSGYVCVCYGRFDVP
jgi:hypothetical protein